MNSSALCEIPCSLLRSLKLSTESSLDNAKAIRDKYVANVDTKDGRILANAYIKEVSDIEVLLDSLSKYT